MGQDIKEAGNTGLMASRLISFTEFVDEAGGSSEFLSELIELGFIEPVQSASGEFLFSQTHVYKVRKLERICKDFDVSVTAGVIIVDLLLRVEELEQRIKGLTSQSG